MIPLPEWAPNVHPLIIHFPIALLATAILVDLISLFTRKWAGIRISAVLLYVLGALGTLAAYLTGRDAADALDLPASVIPHVTDHADWAEITVWFFGIYAVVRLLALWFDIKGRSWAQVRVHALLFLAGAAGYYLVVQTGDHGAQLVYAYGVGVQPVMEQAAVGPAEQEPPAAPGEVARVQVQENGSWQWRPGIGARQALAEGFRFVQGSFDDLRVEAAGADSVLAVQLQSSPVLFTAGAQIASVQAESMLNVSQFDGTVRLVHHVQDAQHYDFLEVATGQMRQGRVQGGEVEIFDQKPLQADGWIDLQAISDGTHFRGYADGEMLTHGHGDAPEPGKVGLYLEGSGTLLLRRLAATSLR